MFWIVYSEDEENDNKWIPVAYFMSEHKAQEHARALRLMEYETHVRQQMFMDAGDFA